MDADPKMPEDFELIITSDGSPTLLPAGGEPMHNVVGAISESEYCYSAPYREFARLCGHAPSLLVVGLGLGAIEMMVQASDTAPSRILSFEAEPALREAMHAWLNNEGTQNPLVNAISLQAQAAAKASDKPSEEIRKSLLHAYREGRWQIAEALTESSLPDQRFEVIAFDAYSKNNSPELWGEDFLAAFFSRACQDVAMLSTYAARGVLKRALREAGFELIKRRGFANKRESTLAVRGMDWPHELDSASM